MKTGEGKTLVATLPAYLNALEGKGVHVVTVNDYLARRDSEWMGRIYRFLGPHRRRHPARADRRRAAGRLRLRHHLRHEQRVRLRLPPRQHEVRARALRAARAPLRDRRRGGQHPHRRGADAAHHLGPGRGVDRALLRGRPHHPEAEGRRGDAGRHEGRGARGARGDRRLHRRREAQDRDADRERHGARPRSCSARRLQPGGLYDPANMPLLHHVNQGAPRAHAVPASTSTTWSRTARSSSSTSSPAA